jgi:hypothetical protein
MPVPVVLTAAYLLIGFGVIVWLAHEEARGRAVPTWQAVLARTAVYGPPLAGFGYLVTIAGDWPFLLFVIAFFSIGALLLNGLLNTPVRPRK